MDKSDETGEREVGANAKVPLEAVLDDAVKIPGTPVMSGGVPLVVGSVLFYRSYVGITGVYLRDHRDKDGKVEAKAGEIHWRSTPFEGATLGNMFEPAASVSPLTKYWIPEYKQAGISNTLFENSTVGALTADNTMVYAVDDLALPIPPQFLEPSALWSNASYVSYELKRLVMQNKLRAHDISSGKFVWELGSIADKTDEFQKSLFLGAPISVGGKLYLLNEKNDGDLRLICVEAHKVTGGNPLKREEWVVKVVPPIQKLATVKTEHAYFRDAGRRVNAIHLAHTDDLLVCPTHAGQVFGVEVATHKVRWTYTYKEDAQPAAQAKQEGKPVAQVKLFSLKKTGPGSFPLPTFTRVSWFSLPRTTTTFIA